MSMSSTQEHDRLRDELAEYALGIGDGRTRSEIVAHVSECDECAEEVASLTAAAESMLRLIPGQDPPAGFESAVLARIGVSDAAPARRPRPIIYSIAAAIVALTFGLGMLTSAATRGPSTSAITKGVVLQRALMANGHPAGVVYAYSGHPSWMFVTVHDASMPSVVRCVVLQPGGARTVVGNFALHSGNGAWGADLAIPFHSVSDVTLTTTSGTTLAQLSPTAWHYARANYSPRAIPAQG